ncbi:MAG: hypothetical protein LBO66_14135 [Deltaproteobacteria bacterium]|jgi:hypothetical protein|nr:hypothetical protein [Deltaproteobacteria bacterium]
MTFPEIVARLFNRNRAEDISRLEPDSLDMVLADPPRGKTTIRWDANFANLRKMTR